MILVKKLGPFCFNNCPLLSKVWVKSEVSNTEKIKQSNDSEPIERGDVICINDEGEAKKVSCLEAIISISSSSAVLHFTVPSTSATNKSPGSNKVSFVLASMNPFTQISICTPLFPFSISEHIPIVLNVSSKQETFE